MSYLEAFVGGSDFWELPTHGDQENGISNRMVRLFVVVEAIEVMYRMRHEFSISHAATSAPTSGRENRRQPPPESRY